MQLGIFAKTFEGHDPSVVLIQVKAAGYSCAQYNMACSGLTSMPDQIDEKTAANVAAVGVEVVAVSGTYNMAHPDVSVREKGLKRLAVLASRCEAMGTKLITLCTGSRDQHDQWRHHADNGSGEAWADLCSNMEAALNIAEQYNVTLGIEPELANVVNSPEKAQKLISEMKSSRLKIVLDAANLFEVVSIAEQRKIVATAIEQLAEHIVIAHAKDRLPTGEFVAAGKGCLDYPHYIAQLKTNNFYGPLITHGLGASEAPQVSIFLNGILNG
jgi:sugar phosphate isomerase/epimerase